MEGMKTGIFILSNGTEFSRGSSPSGTEVTSPLIVTEDRADLLLGPGRYGLFLVGGGGYGDKGQEGASSGYFSYTEIETTERWSQVHVDIGRGGYLQDGGDTEISVCQSDEIECYGRLARGGSK